MDLDIDIPFGKKQERFYYEHKEMMNILIELIALSSAKVVLKNLKKSIPSIIYEDMLRQIESQIPIYRE